MVKPMVDRVSIYELDQDLNAHAGLLKIDVEPCVDVIEIYIVVHFFGIVRRLSEIREWTISRGAVLVEDAVQCLPTGDFPKLAGDYMLTSPYKAMGLGSGAFLISRYQWHGLSFDSSRIIGTLELSSKSARLLANSAPHIKTLEVLISDVAGLLRKHFPNFYSLLRRKRPTGSAKHRLMRLPYPRCTSVSKIHFSIVRRIWLKSELPQILIKYKTYILSPPNLLLDPELVIDYFSGNIPVRTFIRVVDYDVSFLVDQRNRVGFRLVVWPSLLPHEVMGSGNRCVRAEKFEYLTLFKM